MDKECLLVNEDLSSNPPNQHQKPSVITHVCNIRTVGGRGRRMTKAYWLLAHLHVQLKIFSQENILENDSAGYLVSTSGLRV